MSNLTTSTVSSSAFPTEKPNLSIRWGNKHVTLIRGTCLLGGLALLALGGVLGHGIFGSAMQSAEIYQKAIGALLGGFILIGIYTFSSHKECDYFNDFKNGKDQKLTLFDLMHDKEFKIHQFLEQAKKDKSEDAVNTIFAQVILQSQQNVCENQKKEISKILDDRNTFNDPRGSAAKERLKNLKVPDIRDAKDLFEAGRIIKELQSIQQLIDTASYFMDEY